MDNAALTRQQALEAINHTNNQNAHAKTARTYKYVEDYLSQELGLSSWPTLRMLTTPLNVSCRECGGSYVFYRNAPDVQRTPPLYCVWCASPRISIIQFSTDEHSFIVLAQAYGLPVPLTRTLYDLWTTHGAKFPTFRSFVESPQIAVVVKQQLEAVVNG